MQFNQLLNFLSHQSSLLCAGWLYKKPVWSGLKTALPTSAALRRLLCVKMGINTMCIPKLVDFTPGVHMAVAVVAASDMI